MYLFETGINADMSEAIKFSPSPNAISNGEPDLAAIKVPGSCLETTPRP